MSVEEVIHPAPTSPYTNASVAAGTVCGGSVDEQNEARERTPAGRLLDRLTGSRGPPLSEEFCIKRLFLELRSGRFILALCVTQPTQK